MQLLGTMSKRVSATDKSNAAKSMISKKNRYKDRFPCMYTVYTYFEISMYTQKCIMHINQSNLFYKIFVYINASESV